MIKAIIFDLGGVVINFNNTPYYKYLSEKSNMTFKDITSLIDNKYLPIFEKGRMTLKEFEKKLAIDLSIPLRDVKWLEFYK